MILPVKFAVFVFITMILAGNITAGNRSVDVSKSSVKWVAKKVTGEMVVNRAKFDIRYGSGTFFSDLGNKLINDDFTLDFDLEAAEK